MGYLDLSACGREYKYRNLGMMNLCGSIWNGYENIAQNTGDPENVTIIGQSGGGSKGCVCSGSYNYCTRIVRVFWAVGSTQTAMAVVEKQEVKHGN